MMRRSLPWLLVGAVLVAGCAGSGTDEAQPQAEQTSPSDTAGAPAAVASADRGSISGLVVNDEHLPLAGARVSITRPATGTVTVDATGRFTFNDLVPATYGLLVRAAGYESTTARVEVVADQVAQALIVLDSAARPVARSETRVETGYLRDGFAYPMGNTTGNSPAQLGSRPHKQSWAYNVTPDIVSEVAGLRWTPTIPGMAGRLWVQLDLIHVGAPGTCGVQAAATSAYCVAMGRLHGPSPVLIRSDDYQRQLPNVTKGLQVRTVLGIASCADRDTPTDWNRCRTAADLIQVAYDQRIEVYSTVFYVDPAPKEYVPFPPS